MVKDNCIGIGAFCTVFRGTYKGLVCAAKMLTHHAQFYASGMKAQPTVQELALKSLQKECEFLKKLSLLARARPVWQYVKCLPIILTY